MTFEKWWQENKRRARESRLKDAVCEAWHDGYRTGWLANRPKIEQLKADNKRLDGLLAECHAVISNAGWMSDFDFLEKLRAELGIYPYNSGK